MKNLPWAGKTVCWCTNTIALMVLFLPVSLMALPFFQMDDQHQISGTVTDSKGEPLGGVNIIVSGKGQGTISDFDGLYTLIAHPQDTLIYSFMGYKTLEKPIRQSSIINITLTEEIASLKEVVVNAGYYTVKERERTGSIGKVTAEEIELQPVVSPMEALQGRMAGVEIIQQSGMPGNAPVIRIRGQNSLRNSFDDNGNLPLYIIDGVPVNSAPVSVGVLLHSGLDPLSTFNLSDIASIEVLKDADATAIYGSRGANGVVLITTKKGYPRKTEIEARWYSGFSQVGRTMKLLNTRQYTTFRKAAIANADRVPDKDNDWDLTVWNPDRYTDWQKKLLGGTAPLTNFNVTASGGNTTTNFRINGSYQEQGSVFDADISYQKVTTGISVNHTSENDKLNILFGANYGTDHTESFDINGLVTAAYTLPPNAPPLYNDDGTLHWDGWVVALRDNPMSRKYSSTTGISRNLITNLGVSYELLSGLRLKTDLGYTLYTREGKTKTFNEVTAPEKRPDTPHKASQSITKRISWIIEPQLVYHKSFGKGRLDGLIGATFQQNESDDFGVRGEGFTSRALVGYMPAAETLISGNNRSIMYRYNAVFGRLGYQWQSRYYLNLTGRRDGSSRFGPDKRFANFWAIGGAWIFSEEPFVKAQFPFLSFGKLRGSYGLTGSDQIGDYQYLDAYEATSGPNGLYPTQLFNADFAWEENKKAEVSLELGFIEDRLNLNLSWYRNRSSNQLVGFPLSAITGFTSVQANLLATVQNTGWEMEVSAFPVRSGKFRWQSFFNISFPKNKLIAFPDIEQTPYANIYRVGHPLNIRLNYHYTGIDPETGFYTVEDVNGDGSYDYNDRMVVKNMGRKYFGGITNNLSYRGFSLSFLWEFVKQNGPKPYPFVIVQPGDKFNRPIEDYRKWENGELYVETTSASDRAYSRWTQSEHGVIDASFLRLKTLSLSYDISPSFLRNTGVKKCRVYCAAQNLFAISSYSGVNLDSPGINLFAVMRTLTGGIQLSL